MGRGRIPRGGRFAMLLALLLAGLVVITPVAGFEFADAAGDHPAATGGEAVRERQAPPDVKLVVPAPSGQAELWPYTSRRKNFSTLTLPINLVVRGPPDKVRARLQGGAFDKVNRTWRGLSPGTETVTNDTPVWYETSGATRYTYVYAPDGEGGWMDESSQLQYGTYYGSRYHVRLYGYRSENASWTAVQAHYEYWDWFRLRHTVTSLDRARKYVESRYFWRNGVTGVSRAWYANGGIMDADGWVTVVDFAPSSTPKSGTDGKPSTPALRPGGTGGGFGDWVPDAPVERGGSVLVPGLAAGVLLARSSGGGDGAPDDGHDADSRSTSDRLAEAGRSLRATGASAVRRFRSSPTWRRAAALAVLLVAIPSVVRWTAATAEYHLPWLHIKVITGVFYLAFVGGITATAVSLPVGGDDFDWFVLAALSLGVGFLVDFATIHVSILPVVVVLHRLGVLVAVGLLAAGATRRDRDEANNVVLGAGVAAWVATLAWPLFFGL